MKPLVIYTTSDDVPDGLRCLGMFRGGKGLLPIFFNGPTPEAVRETAEKWWAEESARQKKIKGRPKQPTVADVVRSGPTKAQSDEFDDLLA